MRQFMPIRIIMEPNAHLIYDAQLDPSQSMNQISHDIYRTIRSYIGSLKVKSRGSGINLLRKIKLLCELEGVEAELDFLISNINGIRIGMESLRTHFNLISFTARGVRIVDARDLDIRLRPIN